jgi:imidazolonepropionase-like amidohydrolase
VTPRDRRDKDEELRARRRLEHRERGHPAPQRACRSRSSGAEIVDLGGIVGRDIMHLTIEAGFAVRGGLSEQAALEAITIVPARCSASTIASARSRSARTAT